MLRGRSGPGASLYGAAPRSGRPPRSGWPPRPDRLPGRFLDERTKEILVDRAPKARAAVAQLRLSAARCPEEPGFTAPVGELSVKSELFRHRWADHKVWEDHDHNVREKTRGP
ncbi:hypothetical protein [Streptosporangium carneum]|uniref:MmyB family transcriptional regulator n=1 Tax=Streptosporangium carneum TaxID=47481 RepID=UPI0034D98797